MKPETMLARICALLETASDVDRVWITRSISTRYFRPMTSTERSRIRRAKGNASVADDATENATPSLPGCNAERNETVASHKVVKSLASSSNGSNRTVKNTELQDKALEVLKFLNRKAERTFRAVPATVKPILARLRDGATVEDCQVVIARKCAEWKGTDQEKYLRPKTLFSAENFENYLGQARPNL